MAVRGALPSEVEVEWQLDALDLRPVERWLLSAAPGTAAVGDAIGDAVGDAGTAVSVQSRAVKRLVDTYLDTKDWRLGRAGYVLRVRRRASPDDAAAAGSPAGRATASAASGAETGAEVTLKDRAAPVGGLRRRLEVTEPLPADGLGALGPDGPVGRRLHALVGSRSLEALFEVRTRRKPLALRVGDEQVAEVVLDDTVIGVRDSAKPLRMQRVEVEVEPAWVDRLTPFVDRFRSACGLQPATMSKFEAGLLGSGLDIGADADLGPTALSATPTVAEVAFVVLRRNLAAMLAHEAGTRLGDDPEELHDMRVATRRMRAALSLFADVLPAKARSVRSDMGWLADTLGAVRDLDVQLERVEQVMHDETVPGSAALKDLVELLHLRRLTARRTLLTSLESARYDRLVTGFASMLRHGPLRRPGPAHAPALLAIPDLLEAQHRAVTKAAKAARRTGHADDFHRLRIRAKRLRYALEFVRELYPGRTAKYLRRVVRLQDGLGAMQDARVAVEQLRAVAVTEDEPLSRETVFVLGALAEHYRQGSLALAAEVPSRLAALRDDSWRRLVAELDRRRLELAPRYGWAGAALTATPAPPLPPVQAAAAVGAVTRLAADDTGAPAEGSGPPVVPPPA